MRKNTKIKCSNFSDFVLQLYPQLTPGHKEWNKSGLLMDYKCNENQNGNELELNRNRI